MPIYLLKCGSGGQGVAGSNPVNPTSNFEQAIGQPPGGLLCFAGAPRSPAPPLARTRGRPAGRFAFRTVFDDSSRI